VATTKTSADFPRTVYVQWEEDDNDDNGGYWLVYTDVVSLDADKLVGICELKNVRKVVDTRELV
jgi:hypothetical protein